MHVKIYSQSSIYLRGRVSVHMQGTVYLCKIENSSYHQEHIYYIQCQCKRMNWVDSLIKTSANFPWQLLNHVLSCALRWSFLLFVFESAYFPTPLITILSIYNVSMVSFLEISKMIISFIVKSIKYTEYILVHERSAEIQIKVQGMFQSKNNNMVIIILIIIQILYRTWVNIVEIWP